MFSVLSNLISPLAGIPHGVAYTCTLAAGAIVAGTVELVERRNRNTPLHPRRQIELATTIESMPEAVFVIDENGRVVESNQSAGRLTCMSKAALRSLLGDDVARYVADPQGHPGDKTQFAVYRALRGESVLQERHQISRSGAGMLEAMPKSGTLIVGCEHSRDTVRAFVADTGEGILPEKYEELFVPYFTTKQHGTGLGLSSALRAVRAQRGDITFTSKIGEGSRFIVELPAVESGQRAA